MGYSEYSRSNIEEINQLFIKTFTATEGQSEGIIIGELTNNFMVNTDTNDFHCFVATDNDMIIGSVFFSKLRFESGERVYILSPMAISTEYQGKGIGQELITFAHNFLKNNGVEIVVTYGDINFYSKIGYKQIGEDIIKAPLSLSYPEGWLAQSLINDNLTPIKTKPYCLKALQKQNLW